MKPFKMKKVKCWLICPMNVAVTTIVKGRITSVTLGSQALEVRGQMGGCSSPKLGRSLFHSGKFSERPIGSSGRKFTERLQPPPKFGVLLRPWLSYCCVH